MSAALVILSSLPLSRVVGFRLSGEGESSLETILKSPKPSAEVKVWIKYLKEKL